MVSIKEHQNNRLKMDHNEALVSIDSLFSKHHTMKIVEHSQATTGHSYYSNFIPLKAETRFSD